MKDCTLSMARGNQKALAQAKGAKKAAEKAKGQRKDGLNANERAERYGVPRAAGHYTPQLLLYLIPTSIARTMFVRG